MKREILSNKAGFIILLLLLAVTANAQSQTVSFILTDTGQDVFYDADGNEISEPGEQDDFYGQDAQYTSTSSAFHDNGDGTVTDLKTGLMWQQTPDFARHNYYDAFDYVESLEIGGYDDWRLPTIKELYSLLNSNGHLDPTNTSDSQPYLYDEYFDFEYDNNIPYAGQYWSSTKYVKGGLQTNNIEGAFGFNFADGHIKSYETGLYFDGSSGVQDPGCFVRAVRGEEDVYGVNDFTDNGDGTVTDNATGLMWQQVDDGNTYDWQEALTYASESELAGYTDWRLPNTKELQSIVDYDKTTIPAIDETYFTCSDEDSWFWTSTTQGDFKYTACYIAFGYAYSRDNSSAIEYYDWHGAGAQRSDPKTGDPEDYLLESDNADDLLRIDNYVRLVRDVDGTTDINDDQSDNLEIPTKFELQQNYPNPFNPSTQIVVSIPESGMYTLRIYNTIGQEVAVLLDDNINAGVHTFYFDAFHLTSGIYFYNFSGNNFSQTKKMMLQK